MDDDFEEMGSHGSGRHGGLIVANGDVEGLAGGVAQRVGRLDEWSGCESVGGSLRELCLVGRWIG